MSYTGVYPIGGTSGYTDVDNDSIAGSSLGGSTIELRRPNHRRGFGMSQRCIVVANTLYIPVVCICFCKKGLYKKNNSGVLFKIVLLKRIC